MDIVGPAHEALPPEIEPLMVDLAAGAARADRAGVPRSTIDALAAAGLLGPTLETPSLQRELAERIAMADATTWFCWTQHQTPLRTLAGDAAGVVSSAPHAQDQHLAKMRTGEHLAAVAFAHVRRPGDPNPAATRVEGGWRFDGTLDWVTSWDIADVVMIMAQGTGPDAGTLVCAFLPAGRGPGTFGLTVGEPLDLLAMGGTHTRPVTLTDVVVPDSDAVLVDREQWLSADARKTADANPAVFGIARGAINELQMLSEQRKDDRMAALASALTARVVEVRAEAYAAADSDADPELRLALRAQALDLAVQSALAVVTARAGAAMQAGRSTERRMREALFLQVQAQTASSRAASLDQLIRRHSS